MSVTVDANILVYASNSADPVHERALALVERLATGPTLVYLFWPVIIGYIRVVTHPRILPKPLTFDEAATNIDALLERPHVRTAGEGERFWSLFLPAAGRHVRGNAVSDAHIAGLMYEHGVSVIYTRDRDFRRFDGLEARDPLA